MKTQKIYLPNYDWVLRIFYDTKPSDIRFIMNALDNLGCPEGQLEKTYRNVVENGANGGFTYTNVKARETIMSVGYTDSMAQFLNTFCHELGHVAVHVCDYLGVSLKSEEFCYFIGDIAEQMYPCLEPFMCECKGCSH